LKAFARFNTKYSLGLSATPKRADEMERLYFLHTSENMIIHTNTRSIKSVYYPISYSRSMKWKRYPNFIPYNVQVLHNIVADKDRLQFMANIVCSMPDRYYLIVGSRIKYLKEFMEIIEKRLPSKNIMRFFGEETRSFRKKIWQFTFKKGEAFQVRANEKSYKVVCISFNKGKTTANLVVDGVGKYVDIVDVLNDNEHFLQFHIKRIYKKFSEKLEEFEQPELKTLNDADMIFATMQKFKDALNFPHLDTLLSTTPYSDKNTIIQMKGRIERFLEGKRQPLIIEIQDVGIKHTMNTFNTRVSVYAEQGIKRMLRRDFEKLRTA
jgi:superfamily II DNA or RNA helicase